MVIRLAERSLKTQFGTWREVLYYDGREQCIALIYGDVAGVPEVPCRIHSDCISAHVFNSVECDCREQLAMAQIFIRDHGRGIIIWLDQDGRGNGHLALMQAASRAVAEEISQTDAYVQLGYPADRRTYNAAAAVLQDLGVLSVELLSDSPDKARGLAEQKVEIAGTRSVAVDLKEHPELKKYYADKLARGYTITI